jgi:magnesium transporter
VLPSRSVRIAANSPLAEPVILGIRAVQTAVNMNQTIGEALEDLRTRTIDSPVVYVYALDDDDRLVGQVPTRALLFSDPSKKVREVMKNELTTITMGASMADALDVFHKARLLALPVVDQEGRLVGTIDVEQYARESLASAERERVRQVFETLGLEVGDPEHLTVKESFRMRMPWLCCNIAGGILCALIGSRFEHLLKEVVLLSFFLPLVLTLGESVAMQAVTIAVGANPATRSLGAVLRGLRVEAGASILLGIVSAVAVALVTLFWGASAVDAATFFAAVLASMVVAAVAGGAIPLVLHAVRLNPNLAAGPIALVIADTATLAIYFTLGLLILMPEAAP